MPAAQSLTVSGRPELLLRFHSRQGRGLRRDAISWGTITSGPRRAGVAARPGQTGVNGQRGVAQTSRRYHRWPGFVPGREMHFSAPAAFLSRRMAGLLRRHGEMLPHGKKGRVLPAPVRLLRVKAGDGIRDALTGLPGRIAFEAEMARIQERGVTGVGLAILDLNGLRAVNDALGHHTGDELLMGTARLITEICGDDRQAYRIGGDEFALLAPHTPPPQLERLCRRISAACGERLQGIVATSVAWGIAHRPDAGLSVAELYRQAESHMIGSKSLERRSMHSQVTASLQEALKLRNAETAEHMHRMEEMAAVMGRALRLSASERDRLVLLASMHDIGKVSVPDHILTKPGKLTPAEWSVMRAHSEAGYRIAIVTQELADIAEEICCHHERWDGSGYPHGRAGQAIPRLSRIISVADTYDVMTHKRIYKEAVSHAEALEEIRRCSGSQFDPEVARVFLEAFQAPLGKGAEA